MTKRYPRDAYIQTVEALVNEFFDVCVSIVRVKGIATDWVDIHAFNATNHSWVMAEKKHVGGWVENLPRP